MESYPLPKELIKTKTGKLLEDINMENVLNGTVTPEDIKISKETLHKQGMIAYDAGRRQLKENFDRSSELIGVEDHLILEIYNKLRPNRSTKLELLQYAELLENKYNAIKCANFIRNTILVYEKRGILLDERIS